MRLPVVAIVGAPNVGKSTLFNRLIGRRRAIVSDRPGVTRDRIMERCDLFGTPMLLVDTGGVVTAPADALAAGVREEALKAVQEADLILLVVDGRAGVTATDLELAGLLRSSGRPVIPVANKIDAEALEAQAHDASRLGLGEVVGVSAEQGRGLDDLVERLRLRLPPPAAVAEAPGVALALVGRPNVGKSSLFNRLVRAERSLVTPIPGTTRDPVDAVFEHHGTRYRVIDTAGIRRRARAGEEVEWVSVLKARQALEQAEAVIAMVDAVAGIGHQDLAILGLVAGSHRPAVVAANKIDLLHAAGTGTEERIDAIRGALRFAPYVPVIGVSARTGRGIARLLAALEQVRRESARRASTPELNRVLEAIVREKQPPSDRGRDVRFYYITQVGAHPPRFVVFSNGRPVRDSYRRFMEARIRERLGLRAAPIVLSFRRRRRPRRASR
jgi:GTP-binding protein